MSQLDPVGDKIRATIGDAKTPGDLSVIMVTGAGGYLADVIWNVSATTDAPVLAFLVASLGLGIKRSIGAASAHLAKRRSERELLGWSNSLSRTIKQRAAEEPREEVRRVYHVMAAHLEAVRTTYTIAPDEDTRRELLDACRGVTSDMANRYHPEPEDRISSEAKELHRKGQELRKLLEESEEGPLEFQRSGDAAAAAALAAAHEDVAGAQDAIGKINEQLREARRIIDVETGTMIDPKTRVSRDTDLGD